MLKKWEKMSKQEISEELDARQEIMNEEQQNKRY